MATYGERFKAVRLARGLTQETVAARLKFKRAAPVSLLESTKKPPRASSIPRHATALGVEPWELLLNVTTDYDRIRWPDLTEAQREALSSALTVMPKAHRIALADSLAPQVAATLARGGPSRAPAPTLAKTTTAKQIHRGKIRA